jgi:hypothetical protein
MMAKRILFLLIAAITSSLYCSAQNADSSKHVYHFSGTVNATNNGISLVPTFSLGKPAVLALLSLGGKRFSFDPDIRFSWDGKPWTFLFWGRYKISANGKFRMNAGAHLGLNYRSANIIINSVPSDNIVVRRYLAVEASPSYFVAKNISIGSYYLYSHGIDAGTVNNTHFITINVNFSNIPLTHNFYLKAVPQVYGLYQDNKSGYYVTSAFTLARKNFPWSVQSTINKELQSNISGSKDFNWNISIAYSFNQHYVLK